MSNAAIKARLLHAFDAFERGATDIPALQGSWVGHADALEAPPTGFRNTVNQLDGELESIRFTVSTEDQREQATRVVASMRDAVRWVDEKQ